MKLKDHTVWIILGILTIWLMSSLKFFMYVLGYNNWVPEATSKLLELSVVIVASLLPLVFFGKNRMFALGLVLGLLVWFLLDTYWRPFGNQRDFSRYLEECGVEECTPKPK